MKKLLVIFVAACIIPVIEAGAWGRRGHDAVAYIAELNLKPSAKKKIEKILDNHSIVYYSVWMDVYKSDPRYKVLVTCHTAYADEETLQYKWSEYKPEADAVTMVEDCWKRLKDYKNLDDSTVVKNLYALIHILGDMHCPGHVYYESTFPELNKYEVTFMGEKTTLHSVWDSKLVEKAHPGWNYVEWGHQMNKLDKKEIKEVVSGTPRDWFHQTAVVSQEIYKKGVKGAVLKRGYVNDMHPIAERQIQIAGYRLAHILNDIFG